MTDQAPLASLLEAARKADQAHQAAAQAARDVAAQAGHAQPQRER